MQPAEAEPGSSGREASAGPDLQTARQDGVPASSQRTRQEDVSPQPLPSGPESSGRADRIVRGLAWLLPGSMAIVELALAVQAAAARGGWARMVVTSDLMPTMAVAQILQRGDGTRLYDRATQTAEQAAILASGGWGQIHVLPYIHLPLDLLLLWPLVAAGASYLVQYACWTAASLVILLLGCHWLGRAWPLPRGWQGPATLAVLTCFPAFADLLIGQMSAWLFLGWVTTALALRRGRDVPAALGLVLAAGKPLALPLVLPALLVAGRWRVLAIGGAVGGVAVVALMPWLGWDWPWHYWLLSTEVGGTHPDPVLNLASMVNWRGLAVHALGVGGGADLLTAGLDAVTLLAAAAIWWRARHAPATGRVAARSWTVALLANLLVTPYLLNHDLVLAVVPCWMLLAMQPRPRVLAWMTLGWVLAWTAGTWSGPLPPATLWLAATTAWAMGRAWHIGSGTASTVPATRTLPGESAPLGESALLRRHVG